MLDQQNNTFITCFSLKAWKLSGYLDLQCIKLLIANPFRLSDHGHFCYVILIIDISSYVKAGIFFSFMVLTSIKQAHLCETLVLDQCLEDRKNEPSGLCSA